MGWSVGRVLTLGRNYSSLVCSSPGLGRYLTPWRAPVYQRGGERNYSALFGGRQKKKSSRGSSSSIQGDYTAVWLKSLWIKKSRSVSTSGLRRDGLSSCCCCQRLVQKRDKVMERRDGQKSHIGKSLLYTQYLKSENTSLSNVYFWFFDTKQRRRVGKILTGTKACCISWILRQCICVLNFNLDNSKERIEITMSVELIFKIAAVGILVTILCQILKHSGREEHAFLLSLAALLLVLGWIIPYIYDLFTSIQTLFSL